MPRGNGVRGGRASEDESEKEGGEGRHRASELSSDQAQQSAPRSHLQHLPQRLVLASPLSLWWPRSDARAALTLRTSSPFSSLPVPFRSPFFFFDGFLSSCSILRFFDADTGSALDLPPAESTSISARTCLPRFKGALGKNGWGTCSCLKSVSSSHHFRPPTLPCSSTRPWKQCGGSLAHTLQAMSTPGHINRGCRTSKKVASSKAVSHTIPPVPASSASVHFAGKCMRTTEPTVFYFALLVDVNDAAVSALVLDGIRVSHFEEN
eukprot:1796725-Rhodomonas_salina.1